MGGIRAEVSQCSHRHAKGNNKYMGNQCDANLEDSFLIYLDINNLYDAAIQHYLPNVNFEWLKEYDFYKINIFELRYLKLYIFSKLI